MIWKSTQIWILLGQNKVFYCIELNVSKAILRNGLREMKRMYYHLISAVLIAVVISGAYLAFSNSAHPADTPPLLYKYSVSQANSNSTLFRGSVYFNATQGATEQINITFTSLASTPISIPIENLTITSYTDEEGYSFWATEAQPNVINYSLTLSQISLQPEGSNSTVLTINWSNAAPTGTFWLNLYLGNLYFSGQHQKYEVSYSSAIWLGIDVNSKKA